MFAFIVSIASLVSGLWTTPVTDAAGLVPVRAAEKARMTLIQRLTPTVVCLFAGQNQVGGGSGVLIDDEGYGLTNYHVVAAMLPDREGKGGLSDGRLYDVDVLGIDPTGDVAMFRLRHKEPLSFAELGDSDSLRVGDETMAMGNPFMLAEDYSPTVTLGIVSGLHRYQWGSGKALVYTDCIQVDTSINPGNSGGPLFDMTGRLVGINGRVSIEERGRVNVGVGYAISINQIKRFIPALRAGLPTKHAAAGFTVYDDRNEVVVDKILDNSAAYQAGVRLGDRIVRFGGEDITSANHFLSLLGTYPGGWPIELACRREQAVVKHHFRLDAQPLPKFGKGPMPPGAKRVDPYASHPATQSANRRAVRRLVKLHHETLGGPEAVEKIKHLRAAGTRSLDSKPDQPSTEVILEEDRPTAQWTTAPNDAVAAERAIRWALITTDLDAAEKAYKVIASDVVAGRPVAVLEHKGPGAFSYRVALDDADGRLRAVEFKDPGAGRALRYEYGEHRHSGAVRWPLRRRLFIDRKPFSEDVFSEVIFTSRSP